MATDELRARSGAHLIALVGLRLGATLALMHAAERSDVDALVLWSPCISGADFIGEVTKLHKLYLRIEPQLAGGLSPRAKGEEALGMMLPPALIEDLSQIDLLQTRRRPARRTLLIDGGNVHGLEALRGRLQDLGAAPELRSHPGHKFLITVSHRGALPDEVIDSIVGWLKDAYPASFARRTHAAQPVAPAPSGERPICFGKKHPLFGILTPANPARARSDRPPILVLNAGCVNRSGLHRMHVKMARGWAQLGFDVLRVDLSGIGDSPAAANAPENLTYPPSGLEDIGEAIHALGAERVIVVGHCSGGDYAFQVGACEPRVAGVCIINPRTFCVLDLAAVESGDGAPPSAPVKEVPRTLRRMSSTASSTMRTRARRLWSAAIPHRYYCLSQCNSHAEWVCAQGTATLTAPATSAHCGSPHAGRAIRIVLRRFSRFTASSAEPKARIASAARRGRWQFPISGLPDRLKQLLP